MSFLEILAVGVALSMDAMAIILTVTLASNGKKKRQLIEMSIIFALYQGLMPLIGNLIGAAFSQIIVKVGGYLVFAIFAILGGKMIVDSLKQKEEEAPPMEITYKVMLVWGIITSIDALAIGVGLSATQTAIVPASITIAITTFVVCQVAVALGKKFGEILGNKTGLFGGVLLLILAIKSII